MENKKQESSSLPVVLYLAPLLHRVHSVPVWLVAVMRYQGGDGVFLLLLEPDLGTVMGKNSSGAQEVSVSTFHTAGFPPSHPVEPHFSCNNTDSSVKRCSVFSICPRSGDLKVLCFSLAVCLSSLLLLVNHFVQD